MMSIFTSGNCIRIKINERDFFEIYSLQENRKARIEVS